MPAADVEVVRCRQGDGAPLQGSRDGGGVGDSEPTLLPLERLPCELHRTIIQQGALLFPPLENAFHLKGRG